MESRGSSMTDTSPLVRIKKALAKIKKEIMTMELRMGVVGHTLMQAKVRHRTAEDAAIQKEGAGVGDGDDFDEDIEMD